MFRNTMPRYEILSADAVGVLDRGWRRIVSEIGVQFAKPEAVELFRKAGQQVDGDVVRFDPEFVLEQVAKAPREFDVQARNPANSVHIGGDDMVFGAVYGPPFIREGEVRRDATLDDFRRLAMLAQSFPELDSAGGVICEPNDAPLDSRHLDMIYALQTVTDKIYMGNVVSGPNAADTIAMTSILFGGLEKGRAKIEQTPATISLINCNSPLRWDDRMLDAQFEYCAASQPVVLTPFLLMGAMSPVAIPAALAQQLAEALTGIALAQLIRPGCPVIFGSFLSNIDMQSGSPSFGTPESAIGLLCTGQLARHYGLPFRTGGGLNSSQTCDAQAAYESLMTLLPTFLAGANWVMHAGVRRARGGGPRRPLPGRRAHDGAVPHLLLPAAAVLHSQLRAVAEEGRQGRDGARGRDLQENTGRVRAAAAGRRHPRRTGGLCHPPPRRTRRLGEGRLAMGDPGDGRPGHGRPGDG